MTAEQLAQALPAYQAGLEAEISLLKQLRGLAHTQHDATRDRNIKAVDQASDARDRIVSALVLLEQDLKTARQAFINQRDIAQTLPGFVTVLTLHREAVALIGDVLQADRNTLHELKAADAARRAAAQAVGAGEATLAAYRRVLTPTVDGATIIDRKG